MSERTTRSARKRSAARRDSVNDATPDIQPPGSIETMRSRRLRRGGDESEDSKENEGDG